MKLNLALNALLLAVAALLFAGCATHRVDWAGRVGHYTLDQAVVDYGPPDKQFRLSDGRLVAEWITRYNNGGTAIVGGGFYRYPGGVGVVQSTGPRYYERKMRLTFTPDNVLTGWTKD